MTVNFLQILEKAEAATFSNSTPFPICQVIAQQKWQPTFKTDVYQYFQGLFFH